MTYGQPFTPAEVGQVQPGSAAEQGGIHPGDVIVKIDGGPSSVSRTCSRRCGSIPNVPMTIVVRRDGQEQTLQVTPSRTELTDRFGNHYEIGLLGIARSGMEYVKRDPGNRDCAGRGETWNLIGRRRCRRCGR